MKHQKGKKNLKRASAKASTRLAPVTEEEGHPTPEVTSRETMRNVTLNQSKEEALPVTTRPPLQNIAPNTNAAPHSTPKKPSNENNSVDTKATPPQQQDNTTQETNTQLVTTTQTMLEVVLGEVVEIVVDAERNQSNLDVDRLQQLLQFPDMSSSSSSSSSSSNSPSDTLCVSHPELQQIVMRVVVAAKESVRQGTPKPTGIHILSNLGTNRSMVSLSWTNDHAQWPSPPASPRGPIHEIVLGERVCI